MISPCTWMRPPRYVSRRAIFSRFVRASGPRLQLGTPVVSPTLPRPYCHRRFPDPWPRSRHGTEVGPWPPHPVAGMTCCIDSPGVQPKLPCAATYISQASMWFDAPRFERDPERPLHRTPAPIQPLLAGVHCGNESNRIRVGMVMVEVMVMVMVMVMVW